MTTYYAIIQFLFWFTYGSAVNFASVYLLANGASNTMYGIVSAAAGALSIFIQPRVAAYADRDDSLSVKQLVLCVVGIVFACSVGLAFLFGKTLPGNIFLLGMNILLVQVLLPLVNALGTESINAGRKLNFSAARAFGSVGYAAMSFSMGKLIAQYGVKVQPAAAAVIALIFIAATAFFPFSKRKKNAGVRSSGEEGHKGSGSGRASEGMFFRKYPSFTVVLAGCSLIFTGHVYINNYVYQIVVSKGGTSENMGIAMGLAGILEILTMLSFSFMLSKKDAGFWVCFSGIFFTLKSLGSLLAPSMPVFYAVQIFQPLGWGLMTVASVYYVNSIMREEDRVKGQAYMTMTLTIGNIAAALSGGALIDHVGVAGMLIVSILCCAAGSLILTVAVRKEGRVSLP